MFGYAKSKPSKTYSVLTEKGSGNKTIVLGFSSSEFVISFQLSGDWSGLGRSFWVKWNGLKLTFGNDPADSDIPGKYSNSFPSPITPEAEQPTIVLNGIFDFIFSFIDS